MVVAGNPGKIICTVDEYYNRNKKWDIRTKGFSYEEKKKTLLALNPNQLISK